MRALSTSQPHVVMRADSGIERGYGHVMRCITLGRELIDHGYRVSLLGAEISGLPMDRARRADISIYSLTEPIGGYRDIEKIARLKPDLLVADSYDLNAPFFEALAGIGKPLVVLDDNGDVRTRTFELLINQNVHADKAMYPDISDDRLLLGCQYAMIRREVLEGFQRSHSNRRGEKPLVLVALGGTDVRNYAALIAEMLQETIRAEVVVAGRLAPVGSQALPEDISQALIEADVAVVGAGSTLWETCFLGTPTVALVVADNQAASASRLAELGVISSVNARNHLDRETVCSLVSDLLKNEEHRQEMSRRGRQLVDGLGVRRVVQRMKSLLS